MDVKWKNHGSLQSEAYYAMLKENKMTDCILSVPGKCQNAHKIVLAAASPHFMELFTQSATLPDKSSPIVFMNELSSADLSNVIEFVYKGVVNIPLDQLNHFVNVAKSLKLTGIDDFILESKPANDNSNNNFKTTDMRSRLVRSTENRLIRFSSSDFSTPESNLIRRRMPKRMAKDTLKIAQVRRGRPKSMSLTPVAKSSPGAIFAFAPPETPPASSLKTRSQSKRNDWNEIDKELKGQILVKCKYCPCQYSCITARNDHQASCWFNPNRTLTPRPSSSKDQIPERPKRSDTRRSTFIPI